MSAKDCERIACLRSRDGSPRLSGGRFMVRLLDPLLGSPNRMDSIMLGGLTFELMRTGVVVGVFDALADQPGLSAEELAARLRLAPERLEVLLLGLTALH